MNTESLLENKSSYKVKLQPIGRSIEISSGNNLLDGIRLCGIDILSLCGGIGVCDSCKIRIALGVVSDPTINEREIFTEDELRTGLRLACQVHPLSDLTIDVPAESLSTLQRLQTEGQMIKFDSAPVLRTVQLQIPPPSLNDLRSDSSRIIDQLQKATNEASFEIDYGVLKNASQLIRTHHWTVDLVLNNKLVIAILPPNSPQYGVAVDIGTTKIAAYLVELSSGFIIASGGRMNPQISYGEDVISRIAYANSAEQNRQLLTNRVIDEINDLIDELIFKALDMGNEIMNEEIVDAVVVGNTAMHHIFAGFPVEQLGTSPYISTISNSMQIPAREVGLKIAVGAKVYLPPVIAGYIGSDHVAMLSAINIWDKIGTCLALDIGTNTEITLSHDGKLYCCSCASGPAFEGAHIHSGMRASEGAIERVKIEDNKILFTTIGSVSPIGICGSGILDAVSELLSNGFLDRSGGFRTTDKRIIRSGNNTSFNLIPRETRGFGESILITRKDINEIQLAKGAIRTGIEILLKEAAIKADQIQNLFLAGAFGTYLDINSAVNIGMFPDIPTGQFQQVGNAAGVGAVSLLLSKEQRNKAELLKERIKYIELSNHDEFSSQFSMSLFFENALAGNM